MKALVISALALIAALSASRAALPATLDPAPTPFEGCSAWSAPGKTWYISPTADDATGDGSKDKPWSLSSLFNQGAWGSPRISTYPYRHGSGSIYVVDANAAAPVKPGDTILLLSGAYPAFSVGIYGQVIVNPDWLTFAPAPGASPVLAGVRLVNTINKLRFTGLKFRQDMSGAGGPFVLIQGKIQDVLIDHNDLAAVEDKVSAAYQTKAEWEAGVTRGGVSVDGRQGADCVVVANNHAHSVTTAFGSTSASHVRIADNEADHTSRDFIDVSGNHVAVTGNYLHDQNVTSDFHPDGIQGFGGEWEDLVIDGNRIVRQLDPALKFASEMQGINSFDGHYKHVGITRNVVITSTCWGITWGAASYGLIANNTVIFDGLMQPSAGNCQPVVAPFTNTHSYPSGDHVVMLDNIVPAEGLIASTTAGTGTASGPVASAAAGNLVFRSPVPQWDDVKKAINWAKTHAGDIVLGVDAPDNVFVNLGRTPSGAGPFDLHLKSGSPAIGAGVRYIPELEAITAAYPDLKAPETDIEGKPYDKTKPSAGAYAYQPPQVCKAATTNCVQPPPPPPVCTTTPGSCDTPASQ